MLRNGEWWTYERLSGLYGLARRDAIRARLTIDGVNFPPKGRYGIWGEWEFTGRPWAVRYIGQRRLLNREIPVWWPIPVHWGIDETGEFWELHQKFLDGEEKDHPLYAAWLRARWEEIDGLKPREIKVRL